MELAKFHSTLLDQINRAICRNIGDFLKTCVFEYTVQLKHVFYKLKYVTSV